MSNQIRQGLPLLMVGSEQAVGSEVTVQTLQEILALHMIRDGNGPVAVVQK
jgi:hypothetical protein